MGKSLTHGRKRKIQFSLLARPARFAAVSYLLFICVLFFTFFLLYFFLSFFLSLLQVIGSGGVPTAYRQSKKCKCSVLHLATTSALLIPKFSVCCCFLSAVRLRAFLHFFSFLLYFFLSFFLSLFVNRKRRSSDSLSPKQEMQMQRASFGNNKRSFDSDLEFRPPALMQHASFGNNKKRPIDSDLEFQPPKQIQHCFIWQQQEALF